MTHRSGSPVCCDVGDFPPDSALRHSDTECAWVRFPDRGRGPGKSRPPSPPLITGRAFRGSGIPPASIIIICSRRPLTQQQVQPGGAETPSDGFQGLCRKYFGCVGAEKHGDSVPAPPRQPASVCHLGWRIFSPVKAVYALIAAHAAEDCFSETVAQ